MSSIIVLEGKNQGERFDLPDKAIIGRGKEAEVRLADTTLSRRHARLYRSGNDYFVVDLQSSNGTKVNDVPATSNPLQVGDTIRVGSTLLRFEGDAAARPRRPLPPKPTPQAAPLPPKEEDEIRQAPAKKEVLQAGRSDLQARDSALQFSPYAGKKESGLLREDIAQRGFIFKALVVIGLLAIGAGLFFGAFLITKGT